MEKNATHNCDTSDPECDTRRDFMKQLLLTGFALAVQPVSARTILTPVVGLSASNVKIPTPDRAIPAYCAMPERGGPFPTVLVVQEIFGLHEHIRDICRRLAKQGYLAVAPDLYVRQGDVTKMSDIKAIMNSVVQKVPDAQVLADLDATAAWAQTASKGDGKRLALTGFCWGGRIAWLYAAHNPTLKAAAAWYGQLRPESTAFQPTTPHDIASTLKVPVLGLYGGADEGIPMTTIAEMRDALQAGNKASDIVVYPDAPHGFHADYRPSYREVAAKDAWKQMLQWFKSHGVA
jgi:carboxymethylenebutenolidase